MVWASAIAFGYAHIILENIFAMILSTIGGLFFARTYARHHSLAMVSIEHAAYGCLLFTIGLGYYFYGGAVQVH